MTSRGRHSPPPYQVMRSLPAKSAGGDQPAPSSPIWTGESTSMLTLRLPYGFAILVGTLGLVVIILAFWVGWQQGRRSAWKDTLEANAQPLPAAPKGPWLGSPTPILRTSPSTPVPAPGAGTPLATTGGPENPPPANPVFSPGTPLSGKMISSTDSSRDARQKGLNYYVIHYPEAYARQLLLFFWENGVEAQAVKPHNSGLFQVVALQGFRKEELQGPGRKGYEQFLHRLGRLWKAKNPNATDLSSMFLDRFDGEKIESIITREK